MSALTDAIQTAGHGQTLAGFADQLADIFAELESRVDACEQRLVDNESDKTLDVASSPATSAPKSTGKGGK